MNLNRYFDNGATSFPKATGLIDIISEYIENGGTYGRGAYERIFSVSKKIEYVRDSVAEYFGVEDSERIIFTSGATSSLNMVIKTMLKNNAKVLISKLEHNSVMRPLQSLAKSRKLEINYLPSYSDGLIDLSKIKKKLIENVKLVVVSHVSNVNGVIQPIEELKKIIGDIPLLVDGAQSGGEIPIAVDKNRIDYLALAGHKGLLGLPGSGILILGKNSNLDSFIEGGTGSLSEYYEQPDFLPDRLEAGTPNIPGILSVGNGINFLKKNGNNSIIYTKYIIDELKKNKNISLFCSEFMTNQSNLFSFLIEGKDCSEIAYKLYENGKIEVRSGLHCSPLAHKTLGTFSKGGTVRIVPGIFHKEEDIENLIEEIKRIANE